MDSFGSVKQIRLRRCPAFGQRWSFNGKGFFIQVREYLLDYHRVFDAGDHFDCAAAFTARLDADMENPLSQHAQIIDAQRSMAVLESSVEQTPSGTTVLAASLPFRNLG